MISDEKKFLRYKKIMEDNQSIVYRVCRLYGGNDSDCRKDLRQEIALNIWKSLDTYLDNCKESTWVWKVASNTAVNEMRHRYRLPKMTECFDESIVDHNEQQRIILDELYEAIALLKPEDQEVVFARLDLQNYHEIAQKTGKSEKALSMQYSRIVKQLRKLLKGE